jgi:hypothetical protein
LQQLLAEHQNWATLHAGHVRDVSAALQATHAPAPLVDENDATQLSTLIRHYGHSPTAIAPTILLQAAEFLAICQAHDQQLEALSLRLSAVRAMEQAMMAQLSGMDVDLERDASERRHPEACAPEEIDRRIRSWAILARQLETSVDAFVTPSGQVFEYIMEHMGQAYHLGTWHIGQGPLQEDWSKIVWALCVAPNPSTVKLPGVVAPTGRGSITLSLALLADRSPAKVLEQLGGEVVKGVMAAAPVWAGPRHTIAVWIKVEDVPVLSNNDKI